MEVFLEGQRRKPLGRPNHEKIPFKVLIERYVGTNDASVVKLAKRDPTDEVIKPDMILVEENGSSGSDVHPGA